MPDVIGLKQGEAIALLEKAGFTVTLKNNHPQNNGQGTVYACTRPDALSMTACLAISIEYPDVIGMTEKEAIARLTTAGFHFKPVYTSTTSLQNIVIAAEPEKSDTYCVILTLQDLLQTAVGKDVKEASLLLKKAGLQVKTTGKYAPDIPLGQVTDADERNGVAILYFNDEKKTHVSQAVDITGECSDHSQMEFRVIAATHREPEGLLELTGEFMISSRTRYTFSPIGTINLDGWPRQVSLQFGDPQDNDPWRSFVISIKDVHPNPGLLRNLSITLDSQSGVLKLSAEWQLFVQINW